MSNMSVARLALLCFFVLAVNSLTIRNKRNMYPDRLWPKDSKTGLVRVPWTMDCSSSVPVFTCDVTKAAVYKAAETLSKNTCIRLQYTSKPPTDYIAVERAEGCSSVMGKQGGRQRISLGSKCEFESTAIHEIMHALGFNHEHNRPDRDDYVTINKENVRQSEELSDGQLGVDFRKAVHSTTLGMPYDYYSVMHYGRDSHTKGGDTITTKDPSKQEIIGHSFLRGGPSQCDYDKVEVDYDKINKLYGCKENAIGKQELVSVPKDVALLLQTYWQGMKQADKLITEGAKKAGRLIKGAAADAGEFITEDVEDFLAEDATNWVNGAKKDFGKFMVRDVPEFFTKDVKNFFEKDVKNFFEKDVANEFNKFGNTMKNFFGIGR